MLECTRCTTEVCSRPGRLGMGKAIAMLNTAAKHGCCVTAAPQCNTAASPTSSSKVTSDRAGALLPLLSSSPPLASAPAPCPSGWLVALFASASGSPGLGAGLEVTLPAQSLRRASIALASSTSDPYSCACAPVSRPEPMHQLATAHSSKLLPHSQLAHPLSTCTRLAGRPAPRRRH